MRKEVNELARQRLEDALNVLDTAEIGPLLDDEQAVQLRDAARCFSFGKGGLAKHAPLELGERLRGVVRGLSARLANVVASSDLSRELVERTVPMLVANASRIASTRAAQSASGLAHGSTRVALLEERERAVAAREQQVERRERALESHTGDDADTADEQSPKSRMDPNDVTELHSWIEEHGVEELFLDHQWDEIEDPEFHKRRLAYLRARFAMGDYMLIERVPGYEGWQEEAVA